jgi:broad specificity phosphatase PhoE
MLVLLVFLLPAGDGGLKPKSPRTRCLGLRPLSDACGRCLRFAVRVPSRAFGYLLHPGLRLMDRLIMETQRHYRPNRIILVRHGESQGNVNKSLYTTTPDSQVQLTARGFEQGLAAGQQLRSIVGDESVCFLYSPYMRTRQTLLGILQSWRGRRVDFFAEPRLREQASHSVPKRLTHARARAQNARRPRVLVRYARQDFGNFQDLQVMRRCYEERRRFGRIWYRFPSGEAGSDVYSRVGDLWGALRRRIDHPRDQPHRNLVLVTHGLLMRFFCMHYLGWTEHEFEQVCHPNPSALEP